MYLSVAKSISTYRIRLDDEDVNYYRRDSTRSGRSPSALEFWNEKRGIRGHYGGAEPLRLATSIVEVVAVVQKQETQQRCSARAAVAFMIILPSARKPQIDIYVNSRELIFMINQISDFINGDNRSATIPPGAITQ